MTDMEGEVGLQWTSRQMAKNNWPPGQNHRTLVNWPVSHVHWFFYSVCFRLRFIGCQWDHARFLCAREIAETRISGRPRTANGWAPKSRRGSQQCEMKGNKKKWESQNARETAIAYLFSYFHCPWSPMIKVSSGNNPSWDTSSSD